MDSGNSGSVQSPSGGSEEFDSGANSISAFFNNNPLSHIGHGPLGNQQSPPLLQQQHQSPSSSSVLFDPLSNYFDHPLSSVTNPNSQLNLDVVWSRNLRSEPNRNDLVGGFMASSSPPPTQQLFTNQQAQSRATLPSMQIPQGPESGTKGSGTSGQPNNNNMVRNSKKRSRASRRAPTTVLTTDTTNFRAMVQEFTGIPAPPFTSSPFPRTRLDLFGTTSSPNYLLRPFAQKLNYPPPLFTTSSMVDAIASTPSTNSTSSTTSINYQLPSELGLLKQPQNPLNINKQQNPILNFVSILQAPPKYPLSNSTDIPSNVSPLKMGAFEGFGLSQGHVNPNLGGVQNMVSSSDGSLPRNENSANPPSWGEAAGSREHDQSLLRSINGRYNNSNTPGLTNGKVNNFSVSSSDFHVDKGPENVATRSEGMVESWICSSD